MTSFPPPPPPSASVPWYRKPGWKGWLLIGIAIVAVLGVISSLTAEDDAAPAVTEAPATETPTITEASTTAAAPTSAAPTTAAPTTVAPTTVAPTTAAPTTAAPTTTEFVLDPDDMANFAAAIIANFVGTEMANNLTPEEFLIACAAPGAFFGPFWEGWIEDGEAPGITEARARAAFLEGMEAACR